MKSVNTKEMRMNVNYVAFVESVKSQKLEEVNKEKLEELYIQAMGLKPSNIQRVSKRVQRAQLREILTNELKTRKMSFEEFAKINASVVDKLAKKASNYVSVSV